MEINTDHYTAKMENFLHRLKEEIGEITSPNFSSCQDKSAITGIDEYIHELNSFYYRSFHDNFFPVYKGDINQEISKLLKLSAENRSIKNYVLASVKRYAKLYNQVKNIHSTLADLHIDYSQKVFNLAQVQEKQNLELYYAINRLKGFLLRFNRSVGTAVNLLTDKELIAMEENLPEYGSILHIISHPGADHVLATDTFNRLVIHLHNILHLFLKLKDNRQPKLIYGQLLAGITDQDLSLADASLHLKKFYETSIAKKLRIYLDFITSHSANNPRVQMAREEVTEWLNNLLMVLQKGMNYLNLPEKEFLNNLAQISVLPEDYLQTMQETGAKTSASIDLLIKELTNAEELIFPSVHAKLLAIIEKSYPVFARAAKQPHLLSSGSLYSLVNQAEQELAFLKIQITFLHQNRECSVRIQEFYKGLIDSLGSHRKLMENIQSDLQRLLAPRNITRAFKDAVIKIDHVTLEKGKPFPQNYLYLLDKHYIETKLSENEKNIVLHEEGDIFIINVEDEIEEVIPYIIISQKG